MEKTKKTCFIIMPISDHIDYKALHFKYVYEDIIKKAIEEANKNLEFDLEPLRADDRKGTQLIHADIIKNCVESEFAICDISSKNPNVMFELGLRQAFGKPTLIIKDTKTSNIFDINGLRYIQYDDAMSYRSVLHDIKSIALAIKDTVEPKENDINTIMKLVELNTSPAYMKELSKDEILNFFETTFNKIIKKMSNLENKMLSNPYKDTSKITITVPEYNTEFKLRYSYFENIQHLFDTIWEKLNFNLDCQLEPYTYGISWEVINLTTSTPIIENRINKGEDYRTLEDAGIYNNDILEVNFL